MNKCLACKRATHGFLLLETMIGVALFAVGLLALARCVEKCLDAEAACEWDARVRLALENRRVEIEGGAVDSRYSKSERLAGMFQGITLRQTGDPSSLEGEGNGRLKGIMRVRLEAKWKEAGASQTKTLTFYVPQASR